MNLICISLKMATWSTIMWKREMLKCWFRCSRTQAIHNFAAVEASNSKVQSLLVSLAGLDLHKVMTRRKEPLLVPHYQLMTLEQLQEAQIAAMERAKAMLEPPPILPERTANGEVIQVDEKLAGAITHRMIFTETSQHKDNQLRSIVVREPDGVLRQATWEERDRMSQVFFPTLGRKMWLPKILSNEILPTALESMLHVKVLDLVCVQCDPQSEDYHRVHKQIYEDVECRGCYDILRSTRYFGGLVWHLLTNSPTPRVYGLLKDMLQRGLQNAAIDLVQLFVLCFPESTISMKVKSYPSGTEQLKAFCEHSDFPDLLSLIQNLEIDKLP